MLILVTIFLLIFIPLVMLVFYVARPRFNVQGFLAVLVILSSWIMVFITRPATTQQIALLQWEPVSLFRLSPALLLDRDSWFFALALTSLAIGVVITSIAQLGQNIVSRDTPAPDHPTVTAELGNKDEEVRSDRMMKPSWLIWAVILSTTSLGILAVMAGNLLTLLLAWTALDIFELVILLSQLAQSKLRERVIIAFSAKMAGTGMIIVGGIMLWAQGASFTFNAISPSVNTLLLIAAGLRLGVLPLHLPFARALPINRNLNTILSLIQATVSFSFVFRTSGVGVSAAAIPYLLAFSLLAGVYAVINWLKAKNEEEAHPYWILATSSIVVSSAILQHPTACLAWSITSLLSGGLIFSMPIRRRILAPLALIGVLSLSALPLSPTWRSADLFQFSPSLGISVTIFSLFSLSFLFVQALLLAGYTYYILQGIFWPEENSPARVERWVWFIFPVGLIFILATHWLIGWMIKGDMQNVPLSGWLVGPVVCIAAGLVIVIRSRYIQASHPVLEPEIRSAWDHFFSLTWIYRSLWRLFHSISRLFSLISAILEGDGGLLWALVLFSLIFVFLQRR